MSPPASVLASHRRDPVARRELLNPNGEVSNIVLHDESASAPLNHGCERFVEISRPFDVDPLKRYSGSACRSQRSVQPWRALDWCD
jgi:hypothetical protein